MTTALLAALICPPIGLDPLEHDHGVRASIQIDEWPDSRPLDDFDGEWRITNLSQLTFGGQNAEAYWNIEGTQLTYQSTIPGSGYPDEQIFTMNVDGSEKTLISTGLGRCTCSYFSPDGRYNYFSSTHERNEGAQVPVDMSEGYVWKVNPDFELYRRDLETGEIEKILSRDGYIAETTIAPGGAYMTFTGSFDGDLEIYRSNLDGSRMQRLTEEFGYDGGPFVSWDGQHIVYRRDNLSTEEERADYSRLLALNMVRPGKLDIWIMDADGSNKRQVTDLGGASFAPFLHPNGEQIIFSSNHHDPSGREFDLFLVNVDGTGLEQVTFSPEFDGFPMFDRTGTKLAWSSNRNGVERGETNVFVADWRSEPPALEATHDVWDYAFAGDPTEDIYLRVWGGTPLSEFGAMGDDSSYSLLRFDLDMLPAETLASLARGQIEVAELVLTHVETNGANLSMLESEPVEVRWVEGDVTEEAWKTGNPSIEIRETPLGSALPSEGRVNEIFRVRIDLNTEAFLEVLPEALELGYVQFALTSDVFPSSQTEGVYKFYSRQASNVDRRPILVLR